MITEEMLTIAEQNGISRGNVRQRIKKYHWSIERAITEPLRCSPYEQYWELAEKNKISKELFRLRIFHGMTPEEAASTPKRQYSPSGDYAVYQGDDILVVGSIEECAEYLGVDTRTVRYYTTPAYHRKIAKRKRSKNVRTAIRLDDEE